jgi:hypothetical protein
MRERLRDGDAREVVVGDVVEARGEDEDAREGVRQREESDGERVDPLQGDGAGAGSGVIGSGSGSGALVVGAAVPEFAGAPDFSFSRFCPFTLRRLSSSATFARSARSPLDER